MNREGEVGAYAIQHGFAYAVCDAKKQDAPDSRRKASTPRAIRDPRRSPPTRSPPRWPRSKAGQGGSNCARALELGGLTPSHGQIALAREQLRLPLYVLIRPRAGDFLYSDLECEAMQRDIEACAGVGCDGVVLGVLDAEGEVDMPRCRALIAAAGNLGVTFHRAFDLSRDPAQALEDLVALGCERVLTSGGAGQCRGRRRGDPRTGASRPGIASW